MRSAVITGPYSVGCVEKPVPEPKGDEVLIKVIEMGICGSDIERAQRGEKRHIGLTIGHELVGTVAAWGDAVTGMEKGARVSIVPLVPCFECSACQKGEYNLCPHYSFIGSRRDGGGAEYVLVPARNVFPIPDSVTDDEAAMLEPLTVAMHAVDRADRLFGSRVLVIGGGVIGQLVCQVARLAGCQEAALTDIVPSKLEIADRCGADRVFDQRDPDCDAQIASYFSGAKHSIVFETSGSAVGKVNAIRYSIARGEVIYVGGTVKDIVLSADQYGLIPRRELTIKGCWMNYSGPFPGYEWLNGIEYLKQKKIVTEGLVTHRYPLEKADEAFKMIFSGKENPVKVMLHP